MQEPLDALLDLAHELGREDRRLAILGEGSVSAKISQEEFAIKSSGASMASLKKQEITTCATAKILQLLERKNPSDAVVDTALQEARLRPGQRRPGNEAIFHAWLLQLENVNFVGHCHPTSVNQVICSPRARDFAERRLFPDEVLCCGPSSVFIPYTDPGIPLARELRERTNIYIQHHKTVPRLIVLQNHGIIALGSNAESVLSCILMASKAAEIFLGSAALGGPNFMLPKDVERIHTRPDEAYHQDQLKI
jgi:rhamnose utilization protein RhaD (predicted bifunctional aldolase and dehydrogenase)